MYIQSSIPMWFHLFHSWSCQLNTIIDPFLGLPTTLGQQERDILPSTLMTQSLGLEDFGAWNMAQGCPMWWLNPQSIEQLDRQHRNFPSVLRVKLKKTYSKPPSSQVSKKNRERMPTKKQPPIIAQFLFIMSPLPKPTFGEIGSSISIME